MTVPISAADYFDFFPSTDHHPGDIWTGLPTFGVLDSDTCTGIVVTPACDLTNGKVESITYLPTIPVRRFFTSRNCLPELKRAIDGLLEAGGMAALLSVSAGHSWPVPAELRALEMLVGERLAASGTSEKAKSALLRAQKGLALMTHCCAEPSEVVSIEHVIALFGAKEWANVTTRIITNGRSDTHFLPADEQRAEWGAIPEHSVALLRFPLSLPIEVLEMAQRVAADQWDASRSTVRRLLPSVEHIPTRPLKRLRLQSRFTADLLTRFTSVFSRLGSPDFTPATVSKFMEDLRGPT
jgi:hypothetical protein